MLQLMVTTLVILNVKVLIAPIAVIMVNVKTMHIARRWDS